MPKKRRKKASKKASKKVSKRKTITISRKALVRVIHAGAAHHSALAALKKTARVGMRKKTGKKRARRR